MKPIDMLPTFAPTHEVRNNEDGTYTVKVTPPKIVGGRGVSVKLTVDQFKRYQRWQNDGVLMQRALYDLSASQREALMTGLNDDEFRDAVGSVPCPDCAGTGGLYASHGGEVIDQPCKTCDGTGMVSNDEDDELVQDLSAGPSVNDRY